MRLAIEEASKAGRMNEVPVGAVVVDKKNFVISTGHNLTESHNDPTAHAEIVAIRSASHKLGTWRLNECTIYVTLEPCVMCAGAIINSRIMKLVYSVPDEKSGAIESLYKIGTDGNLNHSFTCIPGVLAGESRELLQVFFRNIRESKKQS